jgi:ribonuclease HI
MAGRRPTDVQDGPGFFDEESALPSRTGRRLIIEADGGSRGNPGPAAYGAVVRDAETGAVLAEEGRTIGHTTNNVAEYSGLIAGLEMARAIDPQAAVEVRMDSKLVIEQMAGRSFEASSANGFMPGCLIFQRPAEVRWTWVPRAENKAADALVNAALDGAPVTRAV